jgi:putative sigma-54 modulation protein
MELNITGRHIDVTPPLREYVRSKLERLARHFDQVLDVKIILSVDKLQQAAEGTLHLAGKTLHAEAQGQDVYAAIDALVDKLDAQIKKHKERLQDRRGKAADVGANAP